MTRRVSTRAISEFVGSIRMEIQAWIDRESIESLMKGLKESLQIAKDELVSLLIRFEERVSQGFNRELQDLVLKSNIFCLLEKIVWDHELLKKSIKSPFVDEIESNGEIPKIISFLDYKDLHFRAVVMDCILEIGYFGRKEAIEAMLKEGLIKKLVELQRLELGGDLIDMGMLDHERENGEGEKIVLESHPFAVVWQDLRFN
ncbi:unnamed protein product [Dovyalis caffra]|uniref:Uncharacterized protein n=1 Tax=Dovyalis caffra TaxID=77055 RepID=A0AAV1R3U5_9ROSI|nr:unnamed protein product [Dovyalis caffra]